jgi:hypothetical protein
MKEEMKDQGALPVFAPTGSVAAPMQIPVETFVLSFEGRTTPSVARAT